MGGTSLRGGIFGHQCPESVMGCNDHHKYFSIISPRRRRVQTTQGDFTICVDFTICNSLGNLTSFRESGTLSVAILEFDKGVGAKT